MTAVTFPLRLPRLVFAIYGWRWQNDLHEIKYSVCINIADPSSMQDACHMTFLINLA